MSRFTFHEKHTFLNLAYLYSREVYTIISRGGPREISVRSPEEAKILDAFADTVAALPPLDHDGPAARGEAAHDTETVVHMISAVLDEYGFER
jgi:hypothetical protein